MHYVIESSVGTGLVFILVSIQFYMKVILEFTFKCLGIGFNLFGTLFDSLSLRFDTFCAQACSNHGRLKISPSRPEPSQTIPGLRSSLSDSTSRHQQLGRTFET